MARLYDVGDDLSGRTGSSRDRGGGTRGQGLSLGIPIRSLLLFIALGALILWQSFPYLLQHAQPPAQVDMSARYHLCPTSFEENCVLSGKRFVKDDVIISLSDITAPQIFAASCPAEAQLAKRGAARLVALLNDGSFAMRADEEPSPRPGHKSMLVTRDGKSLGLTLIKEGLARPLSAEPVDWCSGKS